MDAFTPLMMRRPYEAFDRRLRLTKAYRIAVLLGVVAFSSIVVLVALGLVALWVDAAALAVWALGCSGVAGAVSALFLMRGLTVRDELARLGVHEI